MNSRTENAIRRAFVTAALCVMAALGAASCNKAGKADKVPQTPAALSNPLEITAGPGLLERLKVGEPAWAEVGSTLTVAARLEVDESRITRVGTPVMGRITSLSVREGEDVRKGQLLALLNSTGLSDSQSAFLKALSQRQLAQRAVDRAQVLLEAQVIGAAELQRREAELAQATADLDAARDQLGLLGMTPEAIEELERTRKINSVSPIVATISGTVLVRRITLGQVIQPADPVFEIADLSSLWVVADVPEQNAGNLRTGQAVDAEVNAFAGATIPGKLSFVSATVNPETRTVRARMDLPNPAGKYKPAMLATMTLKDQTTRQQLVPLGAVVREQDLDHLFVQLNGDTFLLRPVTLGQQFGASRALTDGIKPGEKVVLQGAFHLNNERRRQLLRGSAGE